MLAFRAIVSLCWWVRVRGGWVGIVVSLFLGQQVEALIRTLNV